MTDPTTRNYYIDEASDGTIFNTKGHVIIGSNGGEENEIAFFKNCYDLMFHAFMRQQEKRRSLR
jgi:hypothetical protein